MNNFVDNKDKMPKGILKLKKEKNVFLYGTGNYAQKMIEILRKFQVHISGILVSKGYKKEDTYCNLLVKEYSEENDEKIALVAGFHITKYKLLTDSLLKNENITRLYVLNGCETWWCNDFNFFENQKLFLIDSYYAGLIQRNLNYDYFMKNKKQFDQTYDCLEDEKSKETMEAYLKGHIELENFPLRSLWKRKDVDEQYFPEDIIQLHDQEVFIDCGAYTGDTLANFRKRVQSCKKYYAIEPDKRQYEELREEMAKSAGIGEVVHIPCGVWKNKSCLHFSLESACGVIGNTGKEEGFIDTNSIDEIVQKDEKVSFIKMDIEGAELEALRGGVNTIKRNCPRLAICVYHKREDLITIPQFIKSLNPQYKLYLRPHFPYASEVVLYAIN